MPCSRSSAIRARLSAGGSPPWRGAGRCPHAELAGPWGAMAKPRSARAAACSSTAATSRGIGGRKTARISRFLSRHLAGVEGGLELFVEDAFVGGVHIDQNQAAGVLGQDVDAVELGEGVTGEVGHRRREGANRLAKRPAGRPFRRAGVARAKAR